MAVADHVDRKAHVITWDPGDSDAETVTLYAKGSDEAWHNTHAQPNDGVGVLHYPRAFSGESVVEVRDADGNVIDSGTVTVA